VLSLYCDVDQDSGLRDWTYLRETIRVGSNISYAELDARLSRVNIRWSKLFATLYDQSAELQVNHPGMNALQPQSEWQPRQIQEN
jgi:hypothetical protein